jgi:hypothetical protein
MLQACQSCVFMRNNILLIPRNFHNAIYASLPRLQSKYKLPVWAFYVYIYFIFNYDRFYIKTLYGLTECKYIVTYTRWVAGNIYGATCSTIFVNKINDNQQENCPGCTALSPVS